MIIQNKLNEDVEIIGIDEADSYEAKIDAGNLAWIMNILSTNYRDKPGIIVQEYASNSWDSHIEAGITDKPIVIKLAHLDPINKGKPFIQFIDYGVGISPSRSRIFADYGSSTKRTSATQLGCFGIGAKSAYSYTDQFFVDTTHEGVHYKYICAKNERGIPSINLLESYEIDEDNYSIVTIFLKDNYDIRVFADSIYKKTVYFENISYDVSDSVKEFFPSELKHLDFNEIELLNLKDSPYVIVNSSNKAYNHIHLILGQIPYTIDFNKIRRGHLSFPIGIRIEPSDVIQPIQTREDIDYTPAAITKLNELLDNLQEYLVDRYNTRNTEKFTDFFEYNRCLYDRNKYGINFQLTDTITLQLNNLESTFKKKIDRTKDAKFTKLDLLDFSITNVNLLLLPFIILKKIDRYTLSTTKSYQVLSINQLEKGLIYKVRKGFSKTKKINSQYLFELDKEENGKSRDVCFLMNFTINDIKLKGKNSNDYYSILRLARYPKSEWRAIIKQYQNFIKEIADRFSYYEDIEPDKDFVDRYNSQQKQLQLAKSNSPDVRGDSDLVVYTPRFSSRSDKKYTLDKEYVGYSKLKKIRTNVVYSPTREKEGMLELAQNFWFVRNLEFRVLNQGTFDILSTFDNFIKLDNFMDEQIKPFVRGVTCYIIFKLINKYSFIFKENLEYVKELSTEMYDTFNELLAYTSSYSTHKSVTFNQEEDEFMESALLLLPQLDESIKDQVTKAEKYLEDLNFLQYLRTDFVKTYNSYYKEYQADTTRRHPNKLDLETIKFSSLVFRKLINPKFRLNLNHYQIEKHNEERDERNEEN
jgi:hypothetical protein